MFVLSNTAGNLQEAFHG